MKMIEFNLMDGTAVRVQAAALDDTVRTRGDSVVIEKAKQTVEGALQNMLPMVNRVRETLAASLKEPGEIELEFGVVLTAEAGAVVAKSSLEAHFKVSVTWKK